jgi:hypothetical protein
MAIPPQDERRNDEESSMKDDWLARLARRVFFETDRENRIVRLGWIGRHLPFLVIGAWVGLMLIAGLSGGMPASLLGGLAGLMFWRILSGK